MGSLNESRAAASGGASENGLRASACVPGREFAFQEWLRPVIVGKDMQPANSTVPGTKGHRINELLPATLGFIALYSELRN
jgi:hypothetical protein